MISVIYKDKSIIVCVKEQGILSQPSPNCGESMLSLLAAQCGGEVYPVHRLDRETGGLMVFARTQAAAAKLSAAIAEKHFEKEYLCIVEGIPSEESATLRDLLFKDSARGKSFVVQRMRKGVKEAVLDYTLLASRENRSLLRVRLHTGRTHQIRIQFSSRKLPLAGDRKYGGSGSDLALWSAALAFPHPVTKKSLAFSLLPPASGVWAEFADALDHQ